MLLLFETANGLALFKMPDGTKPDQLTKYEKARNIIKLEDFHKFADMKEAVDAYSGTFAGNPEDIPDILKNFLKDNYAKKANKSEKLAVADQRLGNSLLSNLGIACIYNKGIIDLMREIRGYSDKLLKISPKDETDMQIGLAHSLSRYILRFNCDALDTMVVQAVSLLDDIEKEINLYTMRLKEWYGWHFPELIEIFPNGKEYATAVLIVGNRASLRKSSLKNNEKEETKAYKKLVKEFGEEIATKISEKANMSFGTDITEEDYDSISDLAKEIISALEERTRLTEYIRNRMRAIAPSLTTLVGDVVGARLLAHAGSIVTLARYPASTIQIIGAEKAYFRAVKAGNNANNRGSSGDRNSRANKVRTPKYGILFHSSLVSQQPTRLRGKAARIVACRAALASRHDAIYVRQLHGNAMDMESKELDRIKNMKGKELEDAKKEIEEKIEGNIGNIAENDVVKSVENTLMSFVNRRLDEIQVMQSSKSIKKDRRQIKKTNEKFTKNVEEMASTDEINGKKEIGKKSVFVNESNAALIGSKRKAEANDKKDDDANAQVVKVLPEKKVPEGQVEEKKKLVEVVSETVHDDAENEEMESKEAVKSPKTPKVKGKKVKKSKKIVATPKPKDEPDEENDNKDKEQMDVTPGTETPSKKHKKVKKTVKKAKKTK